MNKKIVEKLKDVAAKRWHKKRRGRAIADVFGGANYAQAFYLHESAFIAGYKLAVLNTTKTKGKP